MWGVIAQESAQANRILTSAVQAWFLAAICYSLFLLARTFRG